MKAKVMILGALAMTMAFTEAMAAPANRDKAPRKEAPRHEKAEKFVKAKPKERNPDKKFEKKPEKKIRNVKNGKKPERNEGLALAAGIVHLVKELITPEPVAITVPTAPTVVVNPVTPPPPTVIIHPIAGHHRAGPPHHGRRF